MVLGQEEFSFPTVLPMAVNVVVLGDFLAPLMLTGLQGLQWQAWLNGELLGLPLVTCQEGFFLQVQVWCGPTLMQNMMVAAPLIVGTLHLDMDAMPDTSLVRVHYIHTRRQYPHIVTCAHGYMHADNDGDLCIGRIAQTLWGPAIWWGFKWSRFILLSHGMLRSSLQTKRRWSWSMKMVRFNLMQLYCSDCIFPPFLGEGAIYCPRRLRKRELIAQLGLQIPCAVNGSACMCYVNSVELTNAGESEVEDGDFIWCLHASPDMGREIEILSVASPSLASVEEDVGPAMPETGSTAGTYRVCALLPACIKNNAKCI